MVDVMIIYDHNLNASENPDILPVVAQNESDFHVIRKNAVREGFRMTFCVKIKLYFKAFTIAYCRIK